MNEKNSVLSYLTKDELLDDSNVYVLFISRDGKIIRINARGAHLLGFSPDELIGSNWFEARVEDGQDAKTDFLSHLDDPDEPVFTQEYSVTTADESRLLCQWQNRVIRDEDGIVMCILLSGHPAESPDEQTGEVEDAETNVTTSWESIHGQIVFKENPLRICHVNGPMESICGYCASELTAMGPSDIRELFLPESRDAFLQCFIGIRDQGETAGEENNKPSSHFGIYGKDGSSVWISAICGSIEYEDEPALQMICVDTTETKRTIDSLRESEEKYRALVENSSDSIVIHRDGVILFVNTTALKLTGFERDDFIGSSVMNFVAPEFEALVLRNMTNRISGKDVPSIYNVEVLRKDGGTIPAEINVSEIHFDGQRAYMIILRDLSEREALEVQLRQAQKMEAIGQLAGGVAHDFNNILQVINGYTELAINSLEEDDPVREMILQISKAGERASELVRQLLLFSRNQVIVTNIMDLNQIVSEHLTMLKRIIGEDIIIDFNPAPDPIYVSADHSMMGQIMLNLCLNARDAMPEGGRIEVETEQIYINSEFCEVNQSASPGYHGLLRVSDTGTGMDEDTMSRIFEPFFSTKGITTGTGLGLSTVYGIVTQHDGVIKVSSEPGKGSTFSIFLPVADRSIEIEEIPQEYEMDETISRTIIIAEDDENVRNLACEVLSNAGHEVITASDGNEAVLLVTDSPDSVDLVILDAVMPVMSGFEAADRIREVRPDMPIIFCSGYSREQNKEDISRFSEDARFLMKPYSMSQLMTAMTELFSDQN